MGWVKDMKSDLIGQAAQKAWDEDLPVFTPRFSMPASAAGGSGDIRDWAMQIASVEAVGWKLQHWAVLADTKAHTGAFPVFRR